MLPLNPIDAIINAGSTAITNIFGDMMTAVLALISIVAIVAGLRWLLYTMAFRSAEDEAENLHYKMTHSTGHSKEVFKMKYRSAMRRLGKFGD